jgi:hypothetical protein
MKSYVICNIRHIFLGKPYQRGWNVRSMWHASKRSLFYRILFRNPEGKRPRGTTGHIVLQVGSEIQILSNGFVWIRTRVLWTWQWTSSFIKFREFIEKLKRYLLLIEYCSKEFVSFAQSGSLLQTELLHYHILSLRLLVVVYNGAVGKRDGKLHKIHTCRIVTLPCAPLSKVQLTWVLLDHDTSDNSQAFRNTTQVTHTRI